MAQTPKRNKGMKRVPTVVWVRRSIEATLQGLRADTLLGHSILDQLREAVVLLSTGEGRHAVSVMRTVTALCLEFEADNQRGPQLSQWAALLTVELRDHYARKGDSVPQAAPCAQGNEEGDGQEVQASEV